MKTTPTTLRRSTLLLLTLAATAAWADLLVKPVKADLAGADPAAKYWDAAPAETVALMAQPMVAPRPAATNTPTLTVRAVHDGKRVAFRLSWKDKDKSEAGRLGTYSDGVALQFPAKPGDTPPPIMMGAKDLPVHIFHWRAQYQADAERGKPTMKDLYPFMSVDMYPLEFADDAADGNPSERDREQFSPGRAEGNPQSYAKTGVDEIIAEGFFTSAVQQGHASAGKGVWKDGEWAVVVSRPLAIEGGSTLAVGKKGFVGFAVWQGGEAEVASRKCLTMVWTNLSVEKE